MKDSKIKRYPALLGHLILSSIVIGSPFCFALNVPFLLLGRFSGSIWRFSNKVTLFGMGLLRWCQPWWRGSIKVDIPKEYWEGTSGTLFVSNHRSHMDVFLLLQQIPGIRILTKHLIFLIPGLNLAAFLFQMILVKRGKDQSFWAAMETVEKALRQNYNVHVFPEMTRAKFGQKELGRFTLAPFQKAIITKTPVVPIVIWGTDYHWPKGEYKIASSGPLIVESLEPIDSKLFKDASQLSNDVKNKIQVRIDELMKEYPYEAKP